MLSGVTVVGPPVVPQTQMPPASFSCLTSSSTTAASLPLLPWLSRGLAASSGLACVAAFVVLGDACSFDLQQAVAALMVAVVAATTAGTFVCFLIPSYACTLSSRGDSLLNASKYVPT